MRPLGKPELPSEVSYDPFANFHVVAMTDSDDSTVRIGWED